MRHTATIADGATRAARGPGAEPSREDAAGRRRPTGRWDMAAAGSLPPTPSAPSWRADVDWLRIVGMAAVFVVHVALVFVPWAPWHIQSRARSDALGQLVLAVAPWVMPLFMMLAGESAYFSLRRRTGRSFVAERVRH